MSEVKKWYVGVYGGEAQARACSPAEFEIINEREGRSFVLSEDFNRVTAERDALQQRLTAADERADVLEGLLRDLYLSDSLSVRQMQRVHEVFNPSAAALKPAQVPNEKPETIAGHDVACRAVNDYKPGKCSHNCKPAAHPKGVPVPKSKPVAKLHAERLTGRDGEYGITVEDSQWFNTCRLTGGEFYLYAEQHAPVAMALPDRDTLRDIIAQAIGGDTYDCTRVWSAWSVGTMSDDDFVPVVDQEARLYDITDACLEEFNRLNAQ